MRIGIWFLAGTVLLLCCATIAASAAERLEHEGPVLLSGAQTLTIENADYYISGDIVLQDHAKLVVRNASVYFTVATTPDVWGAIAAIRAGDNASVELQDARIEITSQSVSGCIMLLGVSGHAQARVVNSTIGGPAVQGLLHGTDYGQFEIDKSSFFELRLDHSAQAVVAGSNVSWAVGLDFYGTVHAEIEGLRPGHIGAWDFPAEGHAGDSVPTLSIRDTQVGAWSICIAESAVVSLRNSHLGRVVLEAGNLSGEINGLRPGPFASLGLRASANLQIPFDLELISTTVDSWILDLVGGNHDAALVNCELAQLGLQDYTGTASVRDSTLTALCAWSGSPRLSFSETSITRGLELSDTTVSIAGDLRFSPDFFVANWENSVLVRSFDVSVRDTSGQPVPDATVSLRDPFGEVEETTDSDGRCKVTVRFTSPTSDLCPSLEASSSRNHAGTAEACLLGDTSLVIQVR